MRRFLYRFLAVILGCLLVGTLAGFYTGRRAGYSEGSDRSRPLPNGAISCKPGPWGELTYIPFSISAPEELLPIRAIQATGTRWFFKGYAADSFVTLLQGTSLTPDQQHELLGPSVFGVRSDGIELTPTADMVFSLPQDAREKMYRILAQSDENGDVVNFMPRNALDEWFATSGVSPEAVALFKKLCFQRGDYVMFSGVAAMLSRMPSYEEKLHFLKSLTRQQTMLLRLHITPQTDAAALAKYWGIGCWHTDVGTILQSLTAISTGTWVNVMMVLPPQPAAEIYDYPRIADNPLEGPSVNRDCAWTSLNFFRDVPDPNFGTMSGVLKELKDNYLPVPDAPRYGDVVLFARPDGFIVHAAIYIADDICFTKNGSTLMHPWMLSTTSDIIQQFAFQLDPNQKLTIKYFRNKEFL
jgi:hypothetical protein